MRSPLPDKLEKSIEGASSAERSPETMASIVYRKLHDDIVKGALPPGEKLRIEFLTERYGMGASPTREALNRLSAESFVKRLDQRGFQVTPVSIEDLAELTRTRCLVNEITLREAILRGDSAWEDQVVLAQHRLRRTDYRVPNGAINPEWEKKHRAFHSALIAACDSRWLIRLSETLFDCADRYRYLSMKTVVERNIVAEHDEIAEAILKRDIDNSVRLLNEHVTVILHRLTQAAANNGGALILSNE